MDGHLMEEVIKQITVMEAGKAGKVSPGKISVLCSPSHSGFW